MRRNPGKGYLSKGDRSSSLAQHPVMCAESAINHLRSRSLSLSLSCTSCPSLTPLLFNSHVFVYIYICIYF